MKNYSDTLLMMKTEFPMRGDLGKKEPLIQAFWDDNKIYEKVLKQNENQPKFFLHDGPPYANGNIHVGHALNKILKDIIIRYKTMCGFYSPYQPGWDTHGLPIENALTKNKKVNRKEMSVSEFRKICESYALEQVEKQKIGFKRLGVLGDWENPYLTLNKSFEAEQIRVFGKMAGLGLIYKGLKPVYWSPSSETALAEAEIEYYDVTSPAIYVAFPVVDGKGLLDKDDKLVIWTTTPWTIPANLAICANSRFDYCLVKCNNDKYVVAKELLESFMKTLGIEQCEIVKTFKGQDLEYVQYVHPLYNRISPVILGDHVTLETGTGLVHTAPGHGADDYVVGRKYNLDILCPVDSLGRMTEEAGEFAGLNINQCNEAILNKMQENGMLLHKSEIVHSYPHDWRTKKPIIFRATPQWFASIDKIRDNILDNIKNVDWIPSWGEIRISNMVKDRDDWCISRQRVWGVPIPVFYAEDGSTILDEKIINHVADIFEEKGSNAWFELDAKELLPEGYTNPASPNGIFKKETDIMDVWFDSGSSHHSAFKKTFNAYPADLYLEGADQYRGWFNSSISTGVALTGKSPYKQVVTHGFTLDGQGRKMSKSLGNTIDPIQVCNEYGADILRLWVASVDYQADCRISKEILAQNSDAYRKIRNTFRFMLGNLFDFDPEKDYVPYEKLPQEDQYMECLLQDIIKNVHEAYSKFAYDEVYRTILSFMSTQLSSYYLDYTKDVLYIAESNSHERRSIQSVIYDLTYALATMLTPIIPHTTEEVYKHFVGNKKESIYLERMPEAKEFANKDELYALFGKLMQLRDDCLKALEDARNEKIIGKSFSAKLFIELKDEYKEMVKDIKFSMQRVFIVSQLELVDKLDEGTEFESAKILVKPAEGVICSRCWQVVDHINEDELCDRCAKILGK